MIQSASIKSLQDGTEKKISAIKLLFSQFFLFYCEVKLTPKCV